MNALDDAREFIGWHVSATDAELDAMTLYAAATHGLQSYVTFGRLLFSSEQAESGKTLAMMVTLSLCSNPMDTEGTLPALHSAMLAASNAPEMPVPTLYRDEISDVYGKNGYNGSRSPIGKFLRKGYKRGATDMVSRNGTEERYSIFTPFVMTGLRSAVPSDVRTRCIVIHMKPGRPERYFDARESEPYAAALQQSLSAAVKNNLSRLASFRARGMHPRLVNRKVEVWEALLAVAYALGGQAWLNRGVSAFAALALDQSDMPVLTPRQQVIRDLATAVAGSDDTIVTSVALADELKRVTSPLYESRSEHGLVCLIRDALPCQSGRIRVNGEQVRAYRVADILAAWESVRPHDETGDATVAVDTDDVSGLADWSGEADKSGEAGEADSSVPAPRRTRMRTGRTYQARVRKSPPRVSRERFGVALTVTDPTPSTQSRDHDTGTIPRESN